jgi:hypothetical protein
MTMNDADFQNLDNTSKAAELVIEAYHGENLQAHLNSMDQATWDDVKGKMQAIDKGMHAHTAGDGGYFPKIDFAADGSINVQGFKVQDTAPKGNKLVQWYENTNNELGQGIKEINTTVGKK